MQRVLAALLVVVSAIALFWRLDGNHLWRDEGTTAVWAKLMAESGDWIPWAYDAERGQLLVQAADGHDVNSRLLPAMQSYLQFYVAGASFALFGATEWSARVPFALAATLALFLLYRLGRATFGASAWALAPPALAVSSIFFLNAARQCRYYALVLLAVSWLLLEMVRYLREPRLAEQRTFYLRLAAAGFLLYLSNYVSFVTSWTALGVFVLLTKDIRLIRGFLATCAVMAVPIVAEFLWLHAEFAESWPPRAGQPLLEVYQGALARRMQDFWRALPIIWLLPAAYLAVAWRRGWRGAAKPLALLAAALPLVGLLVDRDAVANLPAGAFWLVALLCASAPAAYLLCWSGLKERGLWAQLGLLAGLILLVSPLMTVAAGKDKAYTRHYYQILPAAVVVCSLAAAGVARRNQAAGAAVLAGMMAWPNLDYMMGGMDEVVQRQFLRDSSYNGPLIDYLREHLQPGDRVAFLRNVKGMPMSFYFPDMRWVGLLDASAPHNRQFRGRIPDDQFDDRPDADYYVFWDPRGETAKAFSEERYELVWKYEHDRPLGWWDRGRQPGSRRYAVWKRKAVDPGTETP